MINRESYSMIIGLTAGIILVSLMPQGRFRILVRRLLILMLGFTAYFFRDPVRNILEDHDVLYSPADGRIMWIREDEESIMVRVFMSPLDVHINRTPCKGKVRDVEYRPGSHYPAYSEKSDLENESCRYLIVNDDFSVTVRQISGVLARKIVRWVKPGDDVAQGQRIGMIKLGSGCELTFPKSFRVLVSEGDKVYAGLSGIATRKS